jgi:hypothetical protein
LENEEECLSEDDYELEDDKYIEYWDWMYDDEDN